MGDIIIPDVKLLGLLIKILSMRVAELETTLVGLVISGINEYCAIKFLKSEQLLSFMWLLQSLLLKGPFNTSCPFNTGVIFYTQGNTCLSLTNINSQFK